MALKEGQIIIDGRISYPKLFKAEGIKNDPTSKPRYGCGILVPKSDKKAKDAIDAEIARLTKSKLDGVKPKAKDLFLTDGDGDDGDEHSKGCWIVSANRQESQGRPQVVDRHKRPLTAEDGAIFAGYQCRFVLGTYVPKGWKKICASLEVVQLIREDEVFGAGPVNVDDVLPDFADDDDVAEEDDGLG